MRSSLNAAPQAADYNWLHRPSGVHYRIAYTAAGVHELHPISGQCRYATDEQLANAEVWEKKP